MTKRIFRSICIVSICIFFVSTIPIAGVLYDYFSEIQKERLMGQATLAAQGISNEGIDYFSDLSTDGYRITWIAADGSILYDSANTASEMDNHLDREEVQEAIQTGYGESARYSETLTERQFYSARRLSDGSVVRVSGTQYSVFTLIMSMFQPIATISAIAILLAMLLAHRLSKKIVQPLNELDLDKPLSNTEYEELSPLLNRIESQQKQLKYHSAELKRRQDEFQVVTDNMNEGLVLLSDKGHILSINHTASRLLSISKYCIGKDILLLNNSFEMQELLRRAQSGSAAEMTVDMSGGEYQINASPVISDGTVFGIALLIFNITEKEKAEQMRREFSANVSHELKTPLHSISGCAELMKNGIVKPEDIEKFSGQIYTEAQRLIHLVEDIIKLSRLDEGTTEQPRENTDLYLVAQSAVDRLSAEAQLAGVTVTLTGNSAFVYGVPHLLEGIVFNLCDNAIKYNKEKGKVMVAVSDIGNAVLLSVKDTGIGIPIEHQERIFERFYRVDKSHSKEVGGTGLGLSIVKHAALLHRAEISLSSIDGEGTEITVKFPK